MSTTNTLILDKVLLKDILKTNSQISMKFVVDSLFIPRGLIKSIDFIKPLLVFIPYE